MAIQTPLEKLTALRMKLEENQLDGLLVQRADLFQGEEVRACDERLAFISGFTGSAGYALILKDTAAIFSDQRYSLQMQNQTDQKYWQCYDSITQTIKDVICEIADWQDEITLGYDGWTMTVSQVEKLPKMIDGHIVRWIALKTSLIDQIWNDRPAKNSVQYWYMSDQLAGQTAQQKISSLYEAQGRGAILVSSVISANWLLNIRGNALSHTPIFHTMLLVLSCNRIMILCEDFPEPFFQIDGLQIEYRHFSQLSEIAGDLLDGKLQIDKISCPKALFDNLNQQSINIDFKSNVVLHSKAQKNTAELEGMRKAHIQDAIAFCHFWHWFEDIYDTKIMSESELATYLSDFRARQEAYICDSFPAITGFNGNGAIIHYRAKKGEDLDIIKPGVLLIDSGAHYQFGTTDITRCFAIGTPSKEAVSANSLVLGAHLTLSNTLFPKGTTGAHLDAICRSQLWNNKMDYGHGTGHGVGHVLSVHEAPASLSKHSNHPILEGMVLSNEPGYYEPGKFGIRQENLLHIIAVSDGFLGFENLTFVPFDKNLIDKTLLSSSQLQALDKYHEEVFNHISQHLPKNLQKWLEVKCQPL